MKAIINARIYDYDTYIENGYVIFCETIIEIGPMTSFEGEYEVYDAGGMLLIPGLLNGHTHIYSTLFRGAPLVSAPESFQDILDQVWWKFDSKLNLEMIKASAHIYAVDSLKFGVTSVIDHHASGTISKSLKTLHDGLNEIGLKHLLCFESSDRFDLDLCISENEYALKNHGFFGCHASMSLCDESLKRIKRSLKNAPLHIHVAESLEDMKDAKRKYDKTVIERLGDNHLLNPQSILAHCVHITDEDASLIKASDCVIAINPTSNLNNAVGLYNAKLMIEKDLDVIVGTDGLGSNVAREYQYLYYLGKQSMGHPSKLPLDWIKKVIQFSYDFFNKQSQLKIGKLQPHYDSDFILIDYDFGTPVTKDNIFSHLFYGVFDQLKPLAVYVNGHKKIDHYKHLGEIKSHRPVIEELWGQL